MTRLEAMICSHGSRAAYEHCRLTDNAEGARDSMVHALRSLADKIASRQVTPDGVLMEEISIFDDER